MPTPRSRRVLHIAILLALLACLCWFIAGCASLDTWATENPAAVDAITTGVQTGGVMLSPVTSGISGLIAGILTVAIPAGLAVNRAIVAYRQQKAATAAIVKSIDKAKASGDKPGVVDFTDPKTIALITALQGEAGRAAVDAAQGK